MGLVDSIIGAESGGDPNAVNPRSSASGAGQFLDATWLDTIRGARPDLAQGKTDQELLALKTDPQLSREMTEAYANQNGAILAKNGLPVTPGSTYLAHFAGPQGAVKIMQSDPTAMAGDVLGPAVVKANPFLANMTAADLHAWASRKMGGSAPQPQPAPASPVATPSAPSAPLNIAPQAPPIFAPQPQAAPQQQQAQAAPFEAPPQMQGAPIFYAPRRSPDLSKLRAAFQAPIFSQRG
jgi:hypothetical protein